MCSIVVVSTDNGPGLLLSQDIGPRARSACVRSSRPPGTAIVAARVWSVPRGTIRDVDGCVFCQIISGEVPGHLVLETDDLVAFLDTRPVFKGHVLLVPRTHLETLPDLPAGQRDGFLAAAQRLATAVQDALGAQGSFVAINNTVSQSVPHLHLHVVPRTKGDGLRGFFWPRTKYADDAEAAEYAGKLRAALAG